MYNDKFMDLAIKEAEKARKKGEIPVGAVIVYKNKVIAKGFNRKESYNCVLKHAEIIAIEKASKKMKNWRLLDCEMYVTLEPCPMCASAIVQSRINCVYYGCKTKDFENSAITNTIFNEKSVKNSKNKAIFVEKKYCSDILSEFFEKKR